MANEISKETEKIREILAYQSCKEKKINQEGLKKIIDFNQKVAYVTKDDIEEQKTVSVDTIQNWYKQYIKKYYKLY